jgi:hypothetical protein
MNTIAGKELVPFEVDGTDLALSLDSGVVVVAMNNIVADLPHHFKLGPDGSNDVCRPEFAGLILAEAMFLH